MNIHTPRDLGLRIRDERLRLRMAQATLARSVGASRSWVIQMERGNPGAEIGLVLKALQSVGLTMDVCGATAEDESVPGRAGGSESLPIIDLARILDRARGEGL